MTHVAAAPGLPVAIVGIGCRFPGGVSDPASFWRLLGDAVDAITEIPNDRIDLAHYHDPRPATPGRIMTRWGGFLDRIEDFDATFALSFGAGHRRARIPDHILRMFVVARADRDTDAGGHEHVAAAHDKDRRQ